MNRRILTEVLTDNLRVAGFDPKVIKDIGFVAAAIYIDPELSTAEAEVNPGPTTADVTDNPARKIREQLGSKIGKAPRPHQLGFGMYKPPSERSQDEIILPPLPGQ